MASKYQRPNSPFWWVKYKNETGEICREATEFRIGLGADTNACKLKVAELTLAEKQFKVVQKNKHAFANWVETWLKVSHGNSPKTLTKYMECWNIIKRWMLTQGISAPHQVIREHATKFIEWRMKEKIPGLKGKKFVSRNSALLDIRVFRKVMFEASNRGYIVKNSMSRLGLRGDPAKLKPELEPDMIAMVREAVKNTEWKRVSFEIALYQGARFSETCLPLNRVNLADGLITFKLKGGKLHTTMLHPALKPMFEKMIADGRTMSFEMPDRNATRDWSRTFKKLKLKGCSFHCTRVTCITMLARSGRVNEQQAMAYIGHSRAEIHAIYQRLKARDLSACVDAVDIPSGPETQDAPPAKKARAKRSSSSRTGTGSPTSALH